MPKKYYLVTAWVVALGFLFVSTAHACPSVATINPAMNNMIAGADDSPCGNERSDTCQSVRDSLLSLKPSISTPNNLQQAVLLLGPSIKGSVSFLPSSVAATGVHPAFKVPLVISSIVLRI